MYPPTLSKMLYIPIPKDFDCVTCNQTNRKERMPKLSQNTLHDRENLEVGDHVQLDIMYHTESRIKIKFSLIIIGVKGKFVVTGELKDLTTDSIIIAFNLYVIKVQKRPKIITTDRASCFDSEKFASFVRNQGIFIILQP